LTATLLRTEGGAQMRRKEKACVCLELRTKEGYSRKGGGEKGEEGHPKDGFSVGTLVNSS